MSLSMLFSFDFLFLSRQITHSELHEGKCFIADLESKPNECSDVEDDRRTVGHLGRCTLEGGQIWTCVHGHWTGTVSSPGMN